MATHVHSTRTLLLPAAGAQAPLLSAGSGQTSGLSLVASGGPVMRATLTMRAAGLRDRLEARAARRPADPHVPLRDRLIVAHAAAISVRWVFEVEEPRTTSYKAALAVDNEFRRLLSEVLALPAPRTMAGLAVVGLAAAMEVEGALSHRCLENEDKLAAAARAILSLTGTALPASFLGFGDEPDFEARELAVLTPPAG